MQIFFWVALAQLLVACTVPTMNPVVAVATSPFVASASPVPTEAWTQTPTRPSTINPGPVASIAEIPTLANTVSPSPVASTAPTCPSNTGGRRGLYVINVEPLPSLVWNQTPRQFRVRVCNTLAESLVPGSRFRVSIYSQTAKNPIGQTSDLSAQLAPGLHELEIGSWTPGLQNHVTACADLRTVEILVEYSDYAAGNDFRPVLWLDDSERRTFPVVCGGNFP